MSGGLSMSKSLIIIAFTLGLLGAMPVSGEESPAPLPPLRLGILPFMAPERIEGLYGPLARMMEDATQRKVQLRTRATFVEYSKALLERQFDVALIQPFDYVKVADRGHYLPLAMINQSLSAVLAVPKESKIHDPSQLRGQTVATIPQTAAVTLLAMPMLRDAGLDPDRDVTLLYTRGHDACLLETLQGRAAACITARPAMNIYAARRGMAFRVLRESEGLPHVLYVVRADHAPEFRQRMLSLLMEWDRSGAGRKLMALAQIDGHLVPASDADYDPVRRLRNRLGAR